MRKAHRHTKIAMEMIVTFSFLCAVLILVTSIVLYCAVEKKVISMIAVNNQKLLNRDMERVDDLAGIITQTSFYVAGDSNFKQLLKDFPEEDAIAATDRKREIRSYLNNIWINRPEIVGICVYFDGIKETSNETIGFCPTAYLKKTGWIDKLGSLHGIIISGEEIYNRTGTPFNMFSLVSITQENGTVLGYLSFEISTKKLYERCFLDSRASSSSLLFAVNPKGTIVSHENPSFIGKDAKVFPISVAGPLLQTYNHERAMVLRSNVGNLGWTAIEIIPVASVFNTKEILIIVILFCLVGIVIASCCVLLLTRSITKPITNLSNLMKEKNPLAITSPEKYKEYDNEIGTLYRSYDKLQKEILALINQLQESMEKKRSAEVNALRSQITPHFLYNTLDYINWMALDRNQEDISRMLTLLSRFLRLSITNNNLSTTIRQEVEYTKVYLGIFQAKNNGTFTCTFDIDPTILDEEMPQFILQPIVENSIIHGFGKQLVGGIIHISIRRIGNASISFDIKDNGKGMNKEIFQEIVLGQSQQDTKGYGLRNINDRISYNHSGKEFSGLQWIPSPQGTHIRFELSTLQKGVQNHGTGSDTDHS